MRLKSLYISQYKNLRNFSLSFDGNSFLDVFVGKNGTGKSNLFEALIEIFRHLDQLDRVDNKIGFDYQIRYDIGGHETEIEWKAGKLRINQDEDRKSLGQTPFPDNVLIYYSGHNVAVSDLVERYETAFRRRIKGANPEETRCFIRIGPEYKSLLLVVLLSQPDSNKASRFIADKLGVASVGDELLVEFKRPGFASGRLKELEVEGIEAFDSRTHYWGADGITREFLNKLATCIKGEFNHYDVYSRDKDSYRLKVNLELFKKQFKDVPASETFRQFDNLKTLGMLADITLQLKLINEIDATISQFSDGQFQSVYIYSIIELFKDRNCITLLDEPDSFLHPEWQFQFLDQVFEITDTAAKNNHVLMSSHSAATLCSLDEQQISLFKIENSAVSWCKRSKKEVIHDLSDSFIQYSEDESKLHIDNIIRSSVRPILFVEGPSDVSILNTAYRKLYPQENISILIQDAFDRGFIKILLSRKDVFNSYPEKHFFALFDFDEAYNDWRELGGEFKVNDIHLGLCRKLDGKNAHTFLLPVPDNVLLTQVRDENNPTEKIKPKPHFCVEHIFWGIDGLDGWFRKDDKSGVIKFKGDKHKVRFAKEVVPNLDSACFEVFRPMFEFIKSKCQVEAKPGTVTI